MGSTLTDVFDELVRARRGVFLVSSGTPYVGMGFAKEFIELLKERGIVVWRLEGFRSNGRNLEPMLDHIADIAPDGAADVDAAVAADRALRILETWNQSAGPTFVDVEVAE